MVKENGNTFACEIPGCSVTFTSGSQSSVDTELAKKQATYHEQQTRHIGIANLADLDRVSGIPTSPENSNLYHTVCLTINGPELLTGKPVPESYARSVASRWVGDWVPVYFAKKASSDHG